MMKPPLPHICHKCGASGNADADGWPDWDICVRCAGLKTVNCIDCKRGIGCPDWDEDNYCTAGIEK